jgi:hypothetical protein
VVTIAGGRRAVISEPSMLKHLVAVLVVAICCVSSALGAEIIKVTVQASGTVLLDGKPTMLPALEERFKALKATNGSVWYHRENPAAEPPPQGTAVVQLIIKYKLPVSMSAKPDFSDYVDDKGVSRPRR